MIHMYLERRVSRSICEKSGSISHFGGNLPLTEEAHRFGVSVVLNDNKMLILEVLEIHQQFKRLIFQRSVAVIWLKCCRYGVKPYSINQSINRWMFVIVFVIKKICMAKHFRTHSYKVFVVAY